MSTLERFFTHVTSAAILLSEKKEIFARDFILQGFVPDINS